MSTGKKGFIKINNLVSKLSGPNFESLVEANNYACAHSEYNNKKHSTG